jgi:hypothetical protein
MMRQFLKIMVVITIVAGGMFMASHYGNCNDQKYAQYSSQDTELNITMDHMADWKYQESRGAYGSYAQVQFYGEVKDNFAPSIIVTVERNANVKFKPVSAEGLADDLTAKRMRFSDAKVLSRAPAELLGLPVVDMTLSYKQPDQLHNIDAKLVSIYERVMIVQKDDRFYTLRYVNPEASFAEFEAAFLHCVQTFGIKE